MKLDIVPHSLSGTRLLRMVHVVGAGFAEWLALWRSRRRAGFALDSKAERLRRLTR